MDTGTSPDGQLNSAKSLLGEESAFANEFTAKAEQGTVTFAPPSPGDIMSHEFRDETLYSTDGPFLAASYGINIDAELGGLKSMLEEASQTPLALKGVGLASSTRMGLGKLELEAGESYVLDHEHLISWDETVDYSVQRVGNLKSTILCGEDLVFEFTGKDQPCGLTSTCFLEPKNQTQFWS